MTERIRTNVSNTDKDWVKQLGKWRLARGPVFTWSAPTRLASEEPRKTWVTSDPMYTAHFILHDAQAGRLDHVWVGCAPHHAWEHTGLFMGRGDAWAMGTVDKDHRSKALVTIASQLEQEHIPERYGNYIYESVRRGFAHLDLTWGVDPIGTIVQDFAEATSWMDYRSADSRVALARALSQMGPVHVPQATAMIAGMVQEVDAVRGKERA